MKSFVHLFIFGILIFTLSAFTIPDAHAVNFLQSIGSNGSGNGQFNFPQGIALDSTGNIYVVDANNNRVEEFNILSTCTPPVSGDWTIVSSCILQITTSVPANIIVQSGSVLTIPIGV